MIDPGLLIIASAGIAIVALLGFCACKYSGDLDEMERRAAQSEDA